MEQFRNHAPAAPENLPSAVVERVASGIKILQFKAERQIGDTGGDGGRFVALEQFIVREIANALDVS